VRNDTVVFRIIWVIFFFEICIFKTIGWVIEGKEYAAKGGDQAFPVVVLW